MPAYVIFDVDIRDPNRYQDFMKKVKPALDEAGARYLARRASAAAAVCWRARPFR